MENRVLDALALLGPVVVKQLEDMFAQEHQRNKVAQRDQCHEQVTQVPYKFETGHSAKEDEATTREKTEHGERPLLVGQEADIGLSIVIVADDAAIAPQLPTCDSSEACVSWMPSSPSVV